MLLTQRVGLQEQEEVRKASFVPARSGRVSKTADVTRLDVREEQSVCCSVRVGDGRTHLSAMTLTPLMQCTCA